MDRIDEFLKKSEPVFYAAYIPKELSVKKIFVAGHKGMVGSAIVRELKKSDFP